MSNANDPSQIYFIADCHLSEGRSDLIKIFTQFIHHISKPATALYILGDFFNVWMGDDCSEPWAEDIAKTLKAASEQGLTIYFMPGNRDFLLGQAYAKRAGMQILPDPYTLRIQSKHILLKHGDDLCTNDKLHLNFRRISRTRFIRILYTSLPTRLRRAIANWLRKISRGNKPGYANITDATQYAINKAMQAANVQVIIHGHTHRPSIHWVGHKDHWQCRYVLSDWGAMGNTLVWQAQTGLRLVNFTKPNH